MAWRLVWANSVSAEIQLKGGHCCQLGVSGDQAFHQLIRIGGGQAFHQLIGIELRDRAELLGDAAPRRTRIKRLTPVTEGLGVAPL